MRRVTIRSANKTVILPAVVTGKFLNKKLGTTSVTLGSVTPLRSGEALKGFIFVGLTDREFDLSGYYDLFLPNRQWLGRIEATSEALV